MGGLFGRWSRHRLSVLGAAVALLVVAGMPIGRAEPPLDDVFGARPIVYPDLQPDVKNLFVTWWDIDTPYLLFDTWSKNLGTVPLQVTAEVSENQLAPNVSQCVSWYDNDICREQRPVGGFEFHDVHAHFHYTDFATYTLRRLRPNGLPDYSDAGVISISEKVSFCLIDIERWRDDARELPYYTGGNCWAPAVMGISPGWADVYDETIAGQELNITGLTDGRYALVVDQDPANRLYETDDTNNRVVTIIELSNMDAVMFEETPEVSVVETSWPCTPIATTSNGTAGRGGGGKKKC